MDELTAEGVGKEGKWFYEAFKVNLIQVFPMPKTLGGRWKPAWVLMPGWEMLDELEQYCWQKAAESLLERYGGSQRIHLQR